FASTGSNPAGSFTGGKTLSPTGGFTGYNPPGGFGAPHTQHPLAPQTPGMIPSRGQPQKLPAACPTPTPPPPGTQQPVSPTASVPTNPANQGPKTFGLADLQYLYGGNDQGKLIDLPRILKSLGPGPWTIDQLRQGANLGGLSGRSMSDWNYA